MIPPRKLPTQGMKGTVNPANPPGPAQAQQPPLGRNASVGDTQPHLAARQISGGRPLPFGGANGGAENPNPGRPGIPRSDATGAPQGVSYQQRFGAPPGAAAPPPPSAAPRGYMDIQQQHSAASAASAAASSGGPPRPGRMSMEGMAGGGLTGTVGNNAMTAGLPPSSNGAPHAHHPGPPAADPGAGRQPPPAPQRLQGGAGASNVSQQQPKQQPAAGAAAPIAAGPPPTLRVEDALLYLDDVKREFGDRPGVYNEFLAIMKNFKSQAVDTPGVIARVSKLFRGYNKLILGFNKFLPDGYKISMEDLQNQERIFREEEQAAAAAAAAAQAAQAAVAQAAAAQAAAEAAAAQAKNIGRPQSMPPASLPPQQPKHPAPYPAPSRAPPPAPVRAPHAAQQPVPARGRSSIKVPEQPRRSSIEQHMEVRAAPPPQQTQQPPAHARGPTPGRAPRQKYGAPPGLPVQQHQQPQQQYQQYQQHQQHHQAAPPPVAPSVAQPPPLAAPQQPPPPPPPAGQPPQQQQHQAVEFDHAISYVTTIKRRFASEPGTYHAFLEVLHTYQKEQRGIKEVLEQVADLFQDHPDLLKEFTFFLPDAVQEQAKERLYRAAADSEARQAAQRAKLEQEEQAKAQGQVHGSRRAQQQQARDHPQDMEVEPSGTKARNQNFSDVKGRQQALASTEAGPTTQPRGRKRNIAEATKQTPVQIALPQQPEIFIYNSAVERQFFDSAREALASYSRDGGQAWAEFLKCLDMYAQEILSRNEMLNFVEPLLGKRNTKLFEEFKRILGAAGSQGGPTLSMEDSWHSVPLSEIDFSRCRRCTPSYRALPRDYPAPPCSERSDEEAKVLNNVWVSLPVGSEESYTFRHMRRNTYEEILFRCEDERFEIDMVIDSNAATLARLEPIAAEIAQLAQNELIIPETGTGLKLAPGEAGMGGKRFEYSFDKSILGVIHRNSITRLYGDSGQEMLDLMVKNPTAAVPVVVRRLQQKDREWRVVRDRLNRRWRELAEHNYYRSLDHRSLTWRTTDKRAISTRTLLSEIKDRAAHKGNEGPAAIQARLEKAKEEHGAFYEVTMGAIFKRKLDMTNLPKPDRHLFTPHLTLVCENVSWVHRDAYRILSFALERGAISPADKERCHRLWMEFLGPWFNLSVNWMLGPAREFQEANKFISKDESRISTNGGNSSRGRGDGGGGEDNSPDEDEDESLGDGHMDVRVVTEDVRMVRDDSKAENGDGGDGSLEVPMLCMDHHPLPAGATVSTIYGEGRILSCRRTYPRYKAQDGRTAQYQTPVYSYAVQLPFGTAYLQSSAVLCSVVAVEKSSYTTELREDDRTKLERPGDKLVIGTQSLYLFFRLHQVLVQRLTMAKELAYSIKENGSLINMVEQMPGEDAAALGRRRYDAYLNLVFALLDGTNSLSGGGAAEGGKYEDRVRCLLGHGGYALATMDKLISHILKNLQSMANDDTMWNLIQLYRRHLDGGSFKPDAFRQEASYLSDGESMYCFQLCPVEGKNDSSSSSVGSNFKKHGKQTEVDGNSTNADAAGAKTVLHIEYLGVIAEPEDGAVGDGGATTAINAVSPVIEQSHQQQSSSKRHKRDR